MFVLLFKDDQAVITISIHLVTPAEIMGEASAIALKSQPKNHRGRQGVDLRDAYPFWYSVPIFPDYHA